MYLWGQGAVMIGLGVVLLAVPAFMQMIWPWKTGIMMLQLYSMPLLAYGVGSGLMARLEGWSKLRNGLVAHAVFTGLEFFACLRFSELLNGPALAVAVWLGGLAVVTLAPVGIVVVSLWETRLKPMAMQGILSKRSAT